MIGDRSWRDDLFVAFQQYVADCARRDRPCATFDTWAIERTWNDFTRLARLVLALPEFVWGDWETANPVPMARGAGFHSVNLARRLFDGLILVHQLLRDMGEANRGLALATRQYLRASRRLERLGEAKAFVYGWLCRAAERDGGGMAEMAKALPRASPVDAP
ncbi:MAG: hypothetical protein A2W34_04015 [Chloroflexi bacterium RBG_16_64_32]|nr:MAG: hypothetical protein A2W34_04015 [Chloroflexi bacterium RBG_16_64_32]